MHILIGGVLSRKIKGGMGLFFEGGVFMGEYGFNVTKFVCPLSCLNLM